METEKKRKIDRCTIQKEGLKCLDLDFIVNLLKEGKYFYAVTYSKVDDKISALEEKITNYYNTNYKPLSPLTSNISEELIKRSEKIKGDSVLKSYQLSLHRLRGLKTITTSTLCMRMEKDAEKFSYTSNYGQFALLVQNFDLSRVSVNKLKYFLSTYNKLIETPNLKNLNKFMSFICSCDDIQMVIYSSMDEFIRNKISERITKKKQEIRKLRESVSDLKMKHESSYGLKSQSSGWGSNQRQEYWVLFNENERAKKLLFLKHKP